MGPSMIWKKVSLALLTTLIINCKPSNDANLYASGGFNDADGYVYFWSIENNKGLSYFNRKIPGFNIGDDKTYYRPGQCYYTGGEPYSAPARTNQNRISDRLETRDDDGSTTPVIVSLPAPDTPILNNEIMAQKFCSSKVFVRNINVRHIDTKAMEFELRARKSTWSAMEQLAQRVAKETSRMACGGIPFMPPGLLKSLKASKIQSRTVSETSTEAEFAYKIMLSGPCGPIAGLIAKQLIGNQSVDFQKSGEMASAGGGFSENHDERFDRPMLAAFEQAIQDVQMREHSFKSNSSDMDTALLNVRDHWFSTNRNIRGSWTSRDEAYFFHASGEKMICPKRREICGI